MVKRIYSFEGIRLIMSIFVLLNHLNWIEAVKESSVYNSFFLGMGNFAVCVFFILSGFCRYLSLTKKPEKLSGWMILKQNLHRFLPVHWICLLLILPLEVPTNIRESIILLVNFLLMQSWFPVNGIRGTYGASWYLSTLLVLTCFSSYLVRILKKVQYNNKLRTGMLIGLYSMIILSAYLLGTENTELMKWYLYFNPMMRLIDYFSGMIVAQIYLEKAQSTDRENISFLTGSMIETGAVLAVFVMLSLSSNIPLAYAKVAVCYPIAILLIYLFAFERGIVSKLLSSKIMIEGGQLSLYIFLLHWAIMRYTYGIGRIIGLNTWQ